MNTCWVSQSVIVQCHQILITVTDDSVYNETFNREWGVYWRGCIITNKKWDKNYYQILCGKNFLQIFIMH